MRDGSPAAPIDEVSSLFSLNACKAASVFRGPGETAEPRPRCVGWVAADARAEQSGSWEVYFFFISALAAVFSG